MKRINNFHLCILILSASIVFSDCAASHRYDFSLKDTLAVFMLKNEKTYFFCIPVQYVGDYQIQKFDFSSGCIFIGDYEILLKKDNVNISVFLDELTDEYGNSDGEFNLIYLEEKGKILLSKMNEPPSVKHQADNRLNHYYIFIERFLKNTEVKKINSEYEKGNVKSRFSIEYDLVIDGEQQNGNGMIDDFELYDGLAVDPVWFPSNLDFFKARYLR